MTYIFRFGKSDGATTIGDSIGDSLHTTQELQRLSLQVYHAFDADMRRAIEVTLSAHPQAVLETLRTDASWTPKLAEVLICFARLGYASCAACHIEQMGLE